MEDEEEVYIHLLLQVQQADQAAVEALIVELLPGVLAQQVKALLAAVVSVARLVMLVYAVAVEAQVL
jgi:hypothetical protein